jgi:hypothetical protein
MGDLLVSMFFGDIYELEDQSWDGLEAKQCLSSSSVEAKEYIEGLGRGKREK